MFVHRLTLNMHRKLLSSLFILSDIYHRHTQSTRHTANLSHREKKLYYYFHERIDKAHHNAFAT